MTSGEVCLAKGLRVLHRNHTPRVGYDAAMDALELVRTVATVVGSGSVVIAASAFRHTRDQARTAFEDALAREYRDIASVLPAVAFYELGRAERDEQQRRALFRYFDLSNEQLRLIDEHRIRPKTASVWEAGIKDLMGRETFLETWAELRAGLSDEFFTTLSPA